jgi:hypothetical protein
MKGRDLSMAESIYKIIAARAPSFGPKYPRLILEATMESREHLDFFHGFAIAIPLGIAFWVLLIAGGRLLLG